MTQSSSSKTLLLSTLFRTRKIIIGTNKRILSSSSSSSLHRHTTTSKNVLTKRNYNNTTITKQKTLVPTVFATNFNNNNNNNYENFSNTFNNNNNSTLLAATALTVGTMALSQYNGEMNNSTTYCCGIAGVISSKSTNKSHYGGDARDFLLEGLTILKNRGYDSAGLATISSSSDSTNSNSNENDPAVISNTKQLHHHRKIIVTKYASDGDKADSINLVKEHSNSSIGHNVGIAHTRWATHGGKTDENAHPHLDSSGKIALVHNGTLNNANELRRELQSYGHIFDSQTDTEVIVKLIGHYYCNGTGSCTDDGKSDPNMTVKIATEKALERCDGTWGLCIMCTDTPDELIVACNGSPLVIGIGDDRTFVASETSAFNRYTKNFISMKDGEIGILHSDGRNLDLSRITKAPDQEVKLSPEPYEHWTLKELTEQPEAMARSLGFGGRLSNDKILLGGLDNNYNILNKIKYMTLSACGTSLNAAKYGEKLMKHLGSFNSVTSIDAAETESKDFPNCNPNDTDGSSGNNNSKECGLIVVSQSGETKDVHRVVNTAMDKGITVLSVVNAVGSLIARTTKLGVYCHAGRENAVASTKAFTTQVTVLALIALWFKQCKNKLAASNNNSLDTDTNKSNLDMERLKEALMRLPITFGMTLKSTHKQCKDIAKSLLEKEHCFVLGKGYGEPVAMEGALKIKEMCYLHAEGYSGGALKHGPFALIENDETGKFGATPIIMIILDDQHAQHMRTAAEEVKARGAKVIIITDKPSLARDLDDNPIIIPQNGPMTALGAVLPLQLIAYELALLKGINPDTPRNLAKAVTVD